MPGKTITSTSIGDLDELATSWLRDLRARNLSDRTVQSYGESLRLLTEYLHRQGMPTDVASITREHVQGFIQDQLDRYKDTTAAVRYASIRVFFNWCVEEGEIATSPMARMRKPKMRERVADMPSKTDLQRLLASMSSSSFQDIRDTAIIRTFTSSGARLAELAGLRLHHPERGERYGDKRATPDVDLDSRPPSVFLLGKGDRERRSHLDRRAVKALDKYIRARRQHPDFESEWLWLGKKGRLTASGISQMVRDRADAIGLRLHPHQLRHYWTDRQYRNGVPEGHIMEAGGWRSSEMLHKRYGAKNRSDRALEDMERLSRVDEL